MQRQFYKSIICHPELRNQHPVQNPCQIYLKILPEMCLPEKHQHFQMQPEMLPPAVYKVLMQSYKMPVLILLFLLLCLEYFQIQEPF